MGWNGAGLDKALLERWPSIEVLSEVEIIRMKCLGVGGRINL